MQIHLKRIPRSGVVAGVHLAARYLHTLRSTDVYVMPSGGLIKGKARQGAGLTQQDDVFRPGLSLGPSALRIAEGTAVDALIVFGHP